MATLPPRLVVPPAAMRRARQVLERDAAAGGDADERRLEVRPGAGPVLVEVLIRNRPRR
jgi:phage major head subunit gpT-like protein